MACAICLEYGKSNIFMKGCNRKRVDALNEHVELASQAKKDEERLRILLSRICNYKFIAFFTLYY